MKYILILILLTGCTTGQAAAVGNLIHEVEAVACPLTTIRNLEAVALNALHLIPFFADWEAICRVEQD